MCRDLDDGRSHRPVLPLRIQHGLNFPDYPKYGNWKKSYVITTREFGPTVEYGIGVYALEKNKMIAGNPNARMVRFFIDGNVPANLPLVGDGLLPADIDGTKQPKEDAAIPDRGDTGRQRVLRSNVRRPEHLGSTVKWRLDPDRFTYPRHATASRIVRLDIPLRPG